jgi:hypothetical protein
VRVLSSAMFQVGRLLFRVSSFFIEDNCSWNMSEFGVVENSETHGLQLSWSLWVEALRRYVEIRGYFRRSPVPTDPREAGRGGAGPQECGTGAPAMLPESLISPHLDYSFLAFPAGHFILRSVLPNDFAAVL